MDNAGFLVFTSHVKKRAMSAVVIFVGLICGFRLEHHSVKIFHLESYAVLVALALFLSII